MGNASQEHATGHLAKPASSTGELLVVSDGSFAATELLQGLESRARRMIHATSGEEALGLAIQGGLDLVLVAPSVGGMSGIEFLSRIRENGVETGVVMLLDPDDLEVQRQAHDLGMLTFLPSTAAPEQLVATAALALGHQAMIRQNREMRRRLGLLESGEAAIGCSTAHRRLLGSDGSRHEGEVALVVSRLRGIEIAGQVLAVAGEGQQCVIEIIYRVFILILSIFIVGITTA